MSIDGKYFVTFKCKLTWLLELTPSQRFAPVMAQLKRSFDRPVELCLLIIPKKLS